MDEIPTLRNDTVDKLDKEKDNLAQLRESLQRSDLMTQNMLGILSSFEARLSKLEETIEPIHLETGNLQRRHENIEKTLSSLNNVIEFYHCAEEVEPVINAGPSSGLSNYMQSMEKLQKAVKYFTKHNPASPEMAQVTSQYDVGKSALEKEFRKILDINSKAVPAVLILDVLAVEEDEEPPVIEHFPELVLNDLRDLATWLQKCDHTTDYLSVYASIRSHAVVKSLQSLKDHLKSGSRDSARDSPAMTPKFRGKDAATPSSKKALKRMAFVKKASTAIMKSMAHLEAAGLIKQASSSADLKDDGMDIDIDIYLTSVSALIKLIQSEWALMQGLLPEKHMRKIFDMLIQAGLDFIVREGEQISHYIKRATLKHNTAVIINIFPVLKHLRAIKPEFEITLEGCQAPTRAKLPTLISTLDGTGAKALEDFVDSVRNDPDKVSNMPRDGTVHELTSNTMIFLEQLLEFSDAAGAMLLTQDPTLLADVQNVDRHILKLAHFITQILSNLALNLDNKSETYNDDTLKSIFLVNNYNYMVKTLKKSGMLDVVHMWNNEVAEFLNTKVQDQKRIYSQRNGVLDLVHQLNPKVERRYLEYVEQYRQEYKKSWSRVLHYLSENQKVAVGVVGQTEKLKEKERQIVKDRFVGFNKELEEIVRLQKGYAIPDPELRNTLRQDNRDYIMPFFKGFMRKYEGSNFTKNSEKYVKYREKDLNNIFNSFFDARA